MHDKHHQEKKKKEKKRTNVQLLCAWKEVANMGTNAQRRNRIKFIFSILVPNKIDKNG